MAAPGKRRRPAGRSKASAQYIHAKKRALERYGLELNKEQYQKLCQDIMKNNGVCLGRQSNRLSVWLINVFAPDRKHGVQPVNVVYDKTRHTIVTFLPPGITDAKGVAL